jgi:hypothetical protein
MKNIRTLGLVAVAAIAIVAFVGTSAASAAKFTAGGTEALFTNTIADHAIDITGAEVECETVSFSGTAWAGETSILTMSPSYSKCKAFGFAEASILANGCELYFYAETEFFSNHAIGNIDGCGDGSTGAVMKGIQVSVNVPFFATCLVDLPEQAIGGAVHYTNIGGAGIAVDFTMEWINADVTTSTGFCPLTTGSHTGVNGADYDGSTGVSTAKGFQWDA